MPISAGGSSLRITAPRLAQALQTKQGSRSDSGFDNKCMAAKANHAKREYEHNQFGETPLIAAMRCYVASKFGDEVPDECPSANDLAPA